MQVALYILLGMPLGALGLALYAYLFWSPEPDPCNTVVLQNFSQADEDLTKQLKRSTLKLEKLLHGEKVGPATRPSLIRLINDNRKLIAKTRTKNK